jgi:hypothetical protein
MNMQPMLYSVDTSSFMDWQARRYPTDVFPGILREVDSLIASGRFIAPEIVREELLAVGTQELSTWTDDHDAMFIPVADILNDALDIRKRFPGLLDPRAEYEEADAYVIALARIRGGVVVTEETPASEKNRPRRPHFIPDVCRELGVPCISLLGLMRREQWRF